MAQPRANGSTKPSPGPGAANPKAAPKTNAQPPNRVAAPARPRPAPQQIPSDHVPRDLLGQPKKISVPDPSNTVSWRGDTKPGKATNKGGAVSSSDNEESLPYEKRDFLAESPPFLVSLVVHLFLLLILGLLARAAQPGPLSLFVTLGGPAGMEAEELSKFKIEAMPDTSFEEPQPEMAEAALELIPDVKVDMQALAGKKTSDAKNVEVQVPVALSLPDGGMTAGRVGAAKESLLQLFGGTQVTEDAVKLGLRWLAKQQRKDGSWSLNGPYRDGSMFRDNQTAATAMAMLAFLGSGHTHQTGEYKDTMQRAVTWLVKQQDREGNLVRSAPRDQHLYSHAQATMALCELYGMTNDSSLRAPAQLAINYAVACQNSEGGWRYEPRQDADMSVTGWFVMALMSGRAARLDVPSSVLDRIMDFVTSVQNDEGATYGYQPGRASSPSMTAEGLLSRMYLGWSHDRPALQLGIGTLTQGYPFNYDDRNVYFWYYATQVMHHFGGSPWDQWNEKMRVQLPAAQIKIGAEAGSWPPQGDEWGAPIGRLYTTCLSIYCLEVYYRHMPLYNEGTLLDRAESAKEKPRMQVIPE